MLIIENISPPEFTAIRENYGENCLFSSQFIAIQGSSESLLFLQILLYFIKPALLEEMPYLFRKSVFPSLSDMVNCLNCFTPSYVSLLSSNH